ncbi:YopX family protein [Fusobacterium nucleatum]|uniref:YopX family protein n=1 Tax=Fusobacterium nucleatum TaxID=851 RepID=UPI0030D55B06
MREIKFRAWLKELNEIREVEYINFWKKMISFPNKFCKEYYLNADFDEIELMQYTGLKDKNGKEIYEGDIVKFEDCYFDRKDSFYNIGVIQREGKTDELVIGQLLYKKTDFDENYMNYIEQTFEVCEVIGNIYENSELLGEDK